jgi:RIO kinase 1
MSTDRNFELYEQLEDLDHIPTIRNVPQEQLRHSPKAHHKKPVHSHPDAMAELAEQENELNFSYTASKHEREWLISSLKDFYTQQWFDDVLQLIKGGGKEASVYQCLGNETTQKPYIAAKVYRPRKFRQLRNDSLYREGRLHLDDEGHEIHDGRALHAIRKRTGFGMALLHTSWIEHEFQTMALLHGGGVRVPQPYVSGNNAILMDYIGWDDLPAPTLNTVNLVPQERQRVFDQAVHNVEMMLAHERVHGDLSAFNILYFEGDLFLIDFPQTIIPDQNRNAYQIFRRDIFRLCEYFQAQGLDCQPRKLADDLWQKYGYTIGPEIDPGLLEPEIIEEG